MICVLRLFGGPCDGEEILMPDKPLPDTLEVPYGPADDDHEPKNDLYCALVVRLEEWEPHADEWMLSPGEKTPTSKKVAHYQWHMIADWRSRRERMGLC